jgi:hypothetical protein
LRCGGASPHAATRSRKTHVAHRRIKIERVYRPYLTALEAGVCYREQLCFKICARISSSTAYAAHQYLQVAKVANAFVTKIVLLVSISSRQRL